jgi:hypothetical protein
LWSISPGGGQVQFGVLEACRPLPAIVAGPWSDPPRPVV